jgi:hypothetical protein
MPCPDSGSACSRKSSAGSAKIRHDVRAGKLEDTATADGGIAVEVTRGAGSRKFACVRFHFPNRVLAFLINLFILAA